MKWDYLTIPEAAQRSGVGESTLRRLAKTSWGAQKAGTTGELRGVRRIGRDWVLPVSTVDRLKPRGPGRPAKR